MTAPLWLISLLTLQAAAGVRGTARCKGSVAVAGTRRMLGVREGYALPDNIEGCVGWDKRQNLYADFLICPLAPERPGSMRPVCVESATSLVLERYQDGKKNEVADVRRLPATGCSGLGGPGS